MPELAVRTAIQSILQALRVKTLVFLRQETLSGTTSEDKRATRDNLSYEHGDVLLRSASVRGPTHPAPTHI